MLGPDARELHVISSLACSLVTAQKPSATRRRRTADAGGRQGCVTDARVAVVSEDMLLCSSLFGLTARRAQTLVNAVASPTAGPGMGSKTHVALVARCPALVTTASASSVRDCRRAPETL